MKWEKKGLIYSPKLDKESWMYNSALTPTPILLNDDIIRVYFGARDIKGISRIGYVDLNSRNPSEIISVSKEPVLDIGQPGCFDDNGVILGDIIKVNERLRMYYVGFQLVEKVKFLAFSGVAESTDNGESFTRLSAVPILDRADEGMYIRAIHSVMYENNKWKIWYSAGNDWLTLDNSDYPSYYIKYLESEDGINFSNEGHTCITNRSDEYRLGRSRVYKTLNGYEMYYMIGSKNRSFLPGRAVSSDNLNWTRMDKSLGIELSPTGWDSQNLSYLTLLKTNDRNYMFYIGNNMGADGFGYAESKGEI